MRSFVYILVYLVVFRLSARVSFDLDLRTTFLQTVRLFTGLRIIRKHGLKAESPRTLLNEPIHSFWSFDRRTTEIYSPQRIARSSHKYSTHDVP